MVRDVSGNDAATLLPLNPRDFLILLALSEEDRHGYGLLKGIAGQAQDAITLDPANLYRSIKRLIKSGLVEESGHRPAPEADNERRRYYAITAYGRSVVTAEARRLDSLMATARARNLISNSENMA